MTRQALNAAALYLLSTGLLMVYGIEVCPFLELLGSRGLATVIGAALLVGFSLRYILVWRLHRGGAARPETADVNRPWEILLIDLGIWIAMGLGVTAWNTLYHGFPVPSGLKIVLGCLTLGIFTSTSLALDVERTLILDMSREDGTGRAVAASGRFLSITTKFLVFISLCLGVIFGVLLLLIFKDFQFVIEHYTADVPFEFGWIVKEILFVFGVLLAGTTLVAKRYNRNLRLMFNLQLTALERVEQGQYEATVPVVSQDEFSVIARRTNQMISGLRERERLKTVFGKYMSAPVAREILDKEEGADLGGREVDVAVLFTDIQGFTPLSEKCSPQEVVTILNEYFTLVVRAVHQQQGVLDKFIGDEAMAVFGLGDGANPCDAALAVALDIRRDLEGMNLGFTARGLPPIGSGVGIHYGPVVAGNIGSAERLEYTVIGDTVNTAARLESLTRTIPSPIALSEDVYERLTDSGRTLLHYMGEHELKGKEKPLPVYGLRAEGSGA